MKISQNNTVNKNLPPILLGNNFKKFHLNEGSVVVCSNKYIGISKFKRATNRIGDFIKNKT